MAGKSKLPEMVFEEPPPSRTGKYDWVKAAELARSQPNKWLKVFDEDGHSFFVSLKKGSVNALLPELGFEFLTRNNHLNPEGTRVCKLWVRYNPEKDRSNA